MPCAIQLISPKKEFGPSRLTGGIENFPLRHLLRDERPVDLLHLAQRHVTKKVDRLQVANVGTKRANLRDGVRGGSGSCA
jgi:hypothetical protein